MNNKIGELCTEAINPRTINLDKMSSLEMVTAIMNEESRVVPACLKASKQLAEAVNLYSSKLIGKGRIIEAGSGCSGDYAATDVLELAATFGQKSTGDVTTDKVMSLHTQKGWYVDPTQHELTDKWAEQIKERDTSEDSLTQSKKDLNYFKFGKDDLIVLITASGRSPVIVDLAKEAKKRGGKVISIVMNYNTEISKYSDITIEAIVGMPPLAGSGRTVAGTASKIIITTLSTAAHVKAGAVYSNLMVNLDVKKWLDNSKFIDRAARIIHTITKENMNRSRKILEDSDWNIKRACVMINKNVSNEEAKILLSKVNDNLRKIIG